MRANYDDHAGWTLVDNEDWESEINNADTFEKIFGILCQMPCEQIHFDEKVALHVVLNQNEKIVFNFDSHGKSLHDWSLVKRQKKIVKQS